MKIENIAQLLDRFRSGKCTPEEELVLKAWLHQYNMEDSTNLSDDDFLNARENMLKAIDVVRFPGITKGRTAKTVKLWPRIAAAASIVIVFGAALFYYTVKNRGKEESDIIKYANDIAPGNNGAVLTLANGKHILINDALTGKIASESGVSISKNADGRIIYEITGDNPDSTAYNTLSTLRGQQYQVRLPDGTLVFLNAASSLKYPASFGRLKKRAVELSGEAYFEVAKDKSHPFIVKTARQEVEVLGTHFNINSYSDEPATKTTLLEGSVLVSTLGDQRFSSLIRNHSSILTPGEQSVSMPSGDINIQTADIQEALAWKEGNFVFKGEKIESLMRKIAYWYDVEVVYEGPKTTVGFRGKVSRSRKISAVLEMLELTGSVHFKVDGRRVTVMN